MNQSISQSPHPGFGGGHVNAGGQQRAGASEVAGVHRLNQCGARGAGNRGVRAGVLLKPHFVTDAITTLLRTHLVGSPAAGCGGSLTACVI